MGDSNGMDKKGEKVDAEKFSKLDPDDSSMSIKTGGGLLHKQQHPIDLKDFLTEVRGMMDVNNLLEKAAVILDLQDLPNENPNTSSLESIVDTMLNSMMSRHNETVTKDELKSLIFANSEMDMLANTVQGTIEGEGGGHEVDQNWLCSTTEVPTLMNRMIGITRMSRRTNFGEGANEIKFFILVLCPTNIKGTKTALETARTFATLFSDMSLRHNLLECSTDLEAKAWIRKIAHDISTRQEKAELDMSERENNNEPNFFQPFRGIRDDLARRLPYYWSDYKDGVVGPKSLQKTISTTFFLYFSIILPAIAFGNLQDDNTSGKINVEKILVGQVCGGLIFSILAGQPLVVVMTTAPLVLFTKIILLVAKDFGFSFLPFFAMVGLWNSFFLILYAVFNLSKLMKYSSRSTEETFGNFISIALTVDAMKHLAGSFSAHYNNKACELEDSASHHHAIINDTIVNPLATALGHNITKRAAVMDDDLPCQREVSLLYLILMLGTVWLGVSLFDFVKTPYLSSRKRELLSDYALPVAVVVFSIIGSVVFNRVKLDPFKFEGKFNITLVPFEELTVGAIFFAALLGFSLSILFFMDQNISAAMVNSPENHLKKGNAYHWDLVVVAVINAFLSIFGLPFMHAVLPHSPLHVQCLADKETRVTNGYARDVVTYVRETRLTNIFSNILIGISMLFLQYILPFIPKAVLDGLFLYMAVTALYGNQMFERVTLLVTEQAAYPPNHYVKRVPQRKMHAFTACQLVNLLVLCVFGFTPWPYIKMIFPVVLACFLPIRHKLMPLIIDQKYLEAIDPTTKD